jgi:hypothetical protein
VVKVQPTSTTQTQSQPQSEEEYSIANEKISLELILYDWNKEQEQVSRVIEYNRQAGIRNPEAYIGYGFAAGTTEPADVKRRIRWWYAITNKRTGKPNTLEALRNAGVISDDEMDLFGDNPVFPKRELSQIHRVRQNNGSEWLMRQERFSGLNSIGGVVSIPVTLGYYRRVILEPTTAALENGNQVKVLQVGTTENAYYYLPRIYYIKFTKLNVLDALKVSPPIMEDGVPVNLQYNLMREGHNRTMSASTLEEFTDGDFMEIWERNSKPNPQINISSKDLATYVKLDRESREKANQYG